MTYAFEGLSIVVTALCGVVGLMLLVARTPHGRQLHDSLLEQLRRITGRGDLGWMRWWHFAVIAALLYGAVAAFDVGTGAYACPGGGGESDLIGFLNSGRALLSGGNPFMVADCGTTVPEPYGISALLISAVGSFVGISGVAFVWGVVGVTLVPLTWALAGPDRRYVTLFVVASPLYLPLIVTQIDGASNALVPVTLLASLLLATRTEPLAAALGGFLATGRFPALFPLVAAFGSMRRRYVGALIVVGTFGVVTGLTYAAWRSEFLDVVFFSQIGRRSFSLNVYEILQHHDLLPTGSLLPVLQAALTLAVVTFAFFRVRQPLRAAALTLTAVAILTQYLSFNLLVSLLPVALVSSRARWWLWGVGVVAAMNYDVAFSDWALVGGVYWPTEALDVVLTVLLIGLLVDLVRRGPDPSMVRGPGLAALG